MIKWQVLRAIASHTDELFRAVALTLFPRCSRNVERPKRRSEDRSSRRRKHPIEVRFNERIRVFESSTFLRRLAVADMDFFQSSEFTYHRYFSIVGETRGWEAGLDSSDEHSTQR